MDPNHPIDVDMLYPDSSDDSDVNNNDSELIERPMHKCKYCHKRFNTRQALGGHQNAHKKERQNQIMLNQLYPDPYPYPLSSQYTLPPGFEHPRYTIDIPDNLTVVDNQSQGIDKSWAVTENPYQSVMDPSPVCLDLCLGIGNSSQAQAHPKEPSKDDLSLSLKL